MAENKTKPTNISPEDYIAAVEHPTRRADAEVLLEMMKRITGWEPRMWGPSIIGFGSYDYIYESGHSGTSLRTGFSPRKANLVLYVMPGYADCSDMLDRLGKHRIGKSCLYINKLADVDLAVLEEIVQAGIDEMAERYPEPA
jgi:hypothetical protein